MEVFWRDTIYGLRMMRKSPGIIAIAILALALGVGANTAIFSVVNAMLLHPLNYGNPDQLMMVWEKSTKRGFGDIPTSLPNFIDLRADGKSFEDRGFHRQQFQSYRRRPAGTGNRVRVTAPLLSFG